jgi:hypothetical protein
MNGPHMRWAAAAMSLVLAGLVFSGCGSGKGLLAVDSGGEQTQTLARRSPREMAKKWSIAAASSEYGMQGARTTRRTELAK